MRAGRERREYHDTTVYPLNFRYSRARALLFTNRARGGGPAVVRGGRIFLRSISLTVGTARQADAQQKGSGKSAGSDSFHRNEPFLTNETGQARSLPRLPYQTNRPGKRARYLAPPTLTLLTILMFAPAAF